MKYEVLALEEVKLVIEAEDVCSAMAIVQKKGCVIRSMREVKENKFQDKEEFLKYLRNARKELLKVWDNEEGFTTYYKAQVRMIEIQLLTLIKEVKQL